jgi:hypothetical protein
MVKDVWYCIVDDGARMARHEGDAVCMARIPEVVSGAPTHPLTKVQVGDPRHA